MRTFNRNQLLHEIDEEITRRRGPQIQRKLGISTAEKKAKVLMMQEIRQIVEDAMPAPKQKPKQEDLF